MPLEKEAKTKPKWALPQQEAQMAGEHLEYRVGGSAQ